MNVAVIGHVEWCEFLKIDSLPKPGEIIKANESWHEVAGGGGVSAVQFARHADRCLLFTAVGDDHAGEKVIKGLADLGVEVYASVRSDVSTKRAIIYLDDNKERTITTIGQLEPSGLDESLPWHELENMDAVYFVGGDQKALEYARTAKVLVSTARELNLLRGTNIHLDALVMSSKDSGEQYDSHDLTDGPDLIVRTNGKYGGVTDDGLSYEAKLVTDDEFQDSYGCGDSFAAGLAFGLGEGRLSLDALTLGAEWGAEAARRRGAHGQ